MVRTMTLWGMGAIIASERGVHICLLHDGCCLPAMQALPSDEPAKWQEKEELQDLYSVYVGREKDPGKGAGIAKILGISDKEAQSLGELVSSGQFKLEQDVEEEAFF